jgi:type II secretory pathway component GspD/PulD (secretin)
MKPSFSIALVLTGLLSAAHPELALADTFNQKCGDITSCANAVAALLGQKYLMDSADIKGTVIASGNLEFNRENAELLFTSYLNLLGFSRVPLDNAGTFQIMRQRDARDSAIPLVNADKETEPKLPENWDLYTVHYKATHPESVEHIARTARGFMPANSRIVADELSGALLVTDTALNIRKLYPIMRELDLKVSPALLKKWEESAKIAQQEGMLRMRQQQGDLTKASPPPKPAAAAH